MLYFYKYENSQFWSSSTYFLYFLDSSVFLAERKDYVGRKDFFVDRWRFFNDDKQDWASSLNNQGLMVVGRIKGQSVDQRIESPVMYQMWFLIIPTHCEKVGGEFT